MVWLFLKQNEMADCTKDYIDCDNKNIGIEQLIRLLITEDTNGNTAVRTCSGGGGGLTDVLVGNTLFISKQGKTKANGAIRESLANHYIDPVEAIADAQAGDTIIWFPGTYNETGNIWKPSVNHYFYPGAVINNPTVILDDTGNPGKVAIKGFGTFISNFTSSYAFNIQEATSEFGMEAYKIESPGFATLRVQNSLVDIKLNKLSVTTINYALSLVGNARGRIEVVEKIQGATANTGFNFNLNVVGFTGDIELICPNIEIPNTTNASAGGIVLRNDGGTGKLKVKGNINDLRPSTVTSGGNASVWAMSCEYIHEGDIIVTPNTRVFYKIQSFTGSVDFKGKIKSPNNTSTRVPIDLQGNNATWKFDLEMENGSPYNAQVLQGTSGGNTLDMKGKIINNYPDDTAVLKGIQKDDSTNNKLYINGLIQVFKATPVAVGSYSITGDGLSPDIKVYYNYLSNIDIDPAMNNIISGTNIIIDTNID